MAHFEAYNTNDANAGKYVKIAVVKTTINSSATEVEVESPEGIPIAYEGFVALLGEELVKVTKSTGTTWTLERGLYGTTAASHNAAAEIKSAANQGSGFVPLMAHQELTIGTIQTEKSEKIAGSIYSEEGGTLYIQQSFDGTHWDISTEKSISAATAVSFEVSIIAPTAQVKFVNGSTQTKEFRLFVRAAWQQGR